jgi:archaeal flagellin FlaB
MKKFINILKTQDLGDMGIGAMIVFIAMVLVAGIAASVLVQTANKLEIQAMTTGQQTTAEVATGLSVIDIEGKQASSKIMNMTITVKARAGSGDIDLAQTVVELTDGTKKVLLSYNASATWNYNHTVDTDGNIFGTGHWNQTNEQFGILVLQDGSNHITAAAPVVKSGDLVMLTISCNTCFGGLDARDTIWGQVMPEDGSPGIFAFTVPASLSDTVYDLY